VVVHTLPTNAAVCRLTGHRAYIDNSGFAHVRLTVTDIARSNDPAGHLVGLRPVGQSEFDSTRMGLDHVSFAVSARSDLESAKKGSERCGDTPRRDQGSGDDAGMAIQDPDDINIELTAPLS
jgi:glyoxylase I family protein